MKQKRRPMHMHQRCVLCQSSIYLAGAAILIIKEREHVSATALPVCCCREALLQGPNILASAGTSLLAPLRFGPPIFLTNLMPVPKHHLSVLIGHTQCLA